MCVSIAPARHSGINAAFRNHCVGHAAVRRRRVRVRYARNDGGTAMGVLASGALGESDTASRITWLVGWLTWHGRRTAVSLLRSGRGAGRDVVDRGCRRLGQAVTHDADIIVRRDRTARCTTPVTQGGRQHCRALLPTGRQIAWFGGVVLWQDGRRFHPPGLAAAPAMNTLARSQSPWTNFVHVAPRAIQSGNGRHRAALRRAPARLITPTRSCTMARVSATTTTAGPGIGRSTASCLVVACGA